MDSQGDVSVTSNVKPLYLVPQDLIDYWRQRKTLAQIDSPLDQTLADNTSVRKSTLGQQSLAGTTTSPTDRDLNAKLVREFAEFLTFKKQRDKLRNTTPNVSNIHHASGRAAYDGKAVDETATLDDVLSRIPSSYRKRAQKILAAWSDRTPGLSIEPVSGNVSVKGVTLDNSNIGSLLAHAASGRKIKPTGFEEVAEISRHLPASLFTNPTWKQRMTEAQRERDRVERHQRDVAVRPHSSQDYYLRDILEEDDDDEEEEEEEEGATGGIEDASDDDNVGRERRRGGDEGNNDEFVDASDSMLSLASGHNKRQKQTGDDFEDSAVVDMGDTWLSIDDPSVRSKTKK